MMLSVYERANSDDRTIGELFYMFTAEVSINNALALIVSAFVETVKEFFHVSDEKIGEIMELFLKRLPEYIKNALLLDSKAIITA